MSIEIFADSYDEMKNGFWMINSDIICDNCGKRQPLSSNVCQRCGLNIEYHVFDIQNTFPIFFDSDEETKKFKNDFNLILTTLKTMGYDTNFRFMYKKVTFICSKDKQEVLRININLEESWKIKNIIIQSLTEQIIFSGKESVFKKLVKFL